MKKYLKFIYVLAGLMFIQQLEMRAQPACGSISYLNDMILNGNITTQLLTPTGGTVTSLAPSTNYILRVRATGGTCLVNGSGCNTGAAPIAFIIDFAIGCTVNGLAIPPNKVGRDVGSGNNYTADFNVTTLPSGSFGGQLIILIQLEGALAGTCTRQLSGNRVNFNF